MITYEILMEKGTLIESALEGTCWLVDLDGVEYVVLSDNTVITRDEDRLSDAPIF